jgi:hypothetical protein
MYIKCKYNMTVNAEVRRMSKHFKKRYKETQVVICKSLISRVFHHSTSTCLRPSVMTVDVSAC